MACRITQRTHRRRPASAMPELSLWGLMSLIGLVEMNEGHLADWCLRSEANARMRRVDYHTVLTSVVCFAIATPRGTRVPGVSRSPCSRLRGGSPCGGLGSVSAAGAGPSPWVETGRLSTPSPTFVLHVFTT